MRMRLFVGLDLPAEVVRTLEQLLVRLRLAYTGPGRVQWSPPANLHITTKFIGEFPEDRLAELQTALGRLGPHPPIAVRIRQLGFYPNPKSPRVFWCGVEAPGLAELATATDQAVIVLGVAPEARPYSPHLTLARIKDRIDPQMLQAAITALPRVDFGAFEAASFFLYRSQLHPTGSVYTKLSEFPLNP